MEQIQTLIEQLRPKCIQGFLGQNHLLDRPCGVLYQLFQQKKTSSVIFWGPSGSGKHSLAHLYLQSLSFPLVRITNKQSIEEQFKTILQNGTELPFSRSPTVVWIEEMSLLSKEFQKRLQPFLENNTLILVAESIVNPFAFLDHQFLGQIQSFELKPLSEENLVILLTRAEKCMARKLPVTEKARRLLCQWAGGDAGRLLSWVCQLFQEPEDAEINDQEIVLLLQKRHVKQITDPKKDFALHLENMFQAISDQKKEEALFWLVKALQQELYQEIVEKLIEYASTLENIETAVLDRLIYAGSPTTPISQKSREFFLAQAVKYLAEVEKNFAFKELYGSIKEMAKKTQRPQFVQPLKKPKSIEKEPVSEKTHREEPVISKRTMPHTEYEVPPRIQPVRKEPVSSNEVVESPYYQKVGYQAEKELAKVLLALLISGE